MGAATALITHNAAIAAIADRVVSLADGKIASVVENATRAAARDMRW
jgi:putative ABC transport system ATP-binding protein